MDNISPVVKNKRGQVVRSQKKQCIINVYKSVVSEDIGMSIDMVMQKVAEMVGVGKSTVYRIVSEYKKDHIKGVLSPRNKKQRLCAFDKIDDFSKCAIRRKVHEFFFRNEQPTVEKVLRVVNEDDDLPSFKRTTFFIILKKLGFKFKKRGRNMFLSDRDDIILWRRNYLRTIKKYREEGRPIYYQDETWVNEGHTNDKVWMDERIKSRKDAFLNGLSTGLRNPNGKGKRLIISHVGNEDGFLENGELIFQSKGDDDYHKEMNGEVFLSYFRKIAALCKDNAVIVLDNAPYHSVKSEKLPNSSWNKQNLVDWLDGKGIVADMSLLKKELLQLANKEKPKYNKYVIDEEAKLQQKTILRLPPYHCELNPIELIWSQVKGYVAGNNKTFSLPEVRKLLEEGIRRVTKENWEKCVSHVKKEEEKLWELDNIIEDMEESNPFVINLSNESSDDSDLAHELESSD